MQPAYLVALNGDHPGTETALSSKSMIGSGAGATVSLDGSSAEEEAVIQHDELGWRIFDVGGRSGVEVNDIRADAADLTHGAKLNIAGSTFQFLHGEPEQAPVKPTPTPPTQKELHARDPSPSSSAQAPTPEDSPPVHGEPGAVAALRDQLSLAIVGQDQVVHEVLLAVLCRAHALLVGAPGLAKTLLVSSLAQALDLGYKRVQFTPDLMPADITGTDVLEEDAATGQRSFRFVPGPPFTNLLLADEINRTPPKTQAALLEAMQERQVTVGEETRALPDPFFVLATQNPIEQEGTFPLPEAQLDRFLINIIVDYPTELEEQEVVRRVTYGESPQLQPVLTGEHLLGLQAAVKAIPAADHVIAFATGLTRLSRPKGDDLVPDFVKELVSWGAGPRAAIGLVMAAKANAFIRGGTHATTADVVAVARPVLRHRIIPTFGAEASGVTSDDIVGMLLEDMAPSKELDGV